MKWRNCSLLVLMPIVSGFIFIPHSLAQANCSPAYPTVCIPPPPPDLDCKDIPHKNFKVKAPDPHRFDGDKDGIGCETRPVNPSKKTL